MVAVPVKSFFALVVMDPETRLPIATLNVAGPAVRTQMRAEVGVTAPTIGPLKSLRSCLAISLVNSGSFIRSTRLPSDPNRPGAILPFFSGTVPRIASIR